MLDNAAQIAQTAREQGRALFGTDLAPSVVTVSPVARGTRGIYRVTARPHRPVIVKHRHAETPADRARAAIETSHEFDVLSGVWATMSARGIPEYSVPRPLLAVPTGGLLFMEESLGQPLARHLRCWLVGLRSANGVSTMLLRCGQWLRSFTGLAPRIEWPVAAPETTLVLAAQRVRHHVYKLIGLSGTDLTSTMVEGAVSRLTAWRVEPSLTRRIEAAFNRQFRDFHGSSDQTAVHGKFSPADVLIQNDCVSAVDLEQAGRGSAYLDPAYFLYQIYMLSRWRPLGSGETAVAQFRRSFVRGRWEEEGVDEALLDGFIAYYMCNSLRPDKGLLGRSARSYAERWLRQWLMRSES